MSPFRASQKQPSWSCLALDLRGSELVNLRCNKDQKIFVCPPANVPPHVRSNRITD
jgi:hypothetical protein